MKFGTPKVRPFGFHLIFTYFGYVLGLQEVEADWQQKGWLNNVF